MKSYVEIKDPKTGRMGHWVTIHRNRKYEHIFIFTDKGHRAEISDSKNPYQGYTKGEIRQAALDLEKTIKAEKKELRGLSKSESGLVDDFKKEVRNIGGIRAPKKGDAFYSEYRESVPQSVRRSVGRKNGRKIDEAASELGMSANQMIQKLAQGTPDAELDLKKYMQADIERRHEQIRELEKEVRRMRRAAA